MAAAYIVEAVRTAGGRRGGRLAGWHPADMAGEVLNAVVDRTGIDPAAVEDVVMGCVSQGGEQGFQVGRGAVLASIVSQILDQITALEGLRDYLPTHYALAWADLLSSDVDWAQMAKGTFSALAYGAFFTLLAARKFARKDITS